MNRRAPKTAIAALLTALVGVVGLDARTEPTVGVATGLQAPTTATSGAWYCALGDAGDQESLTVVGAVHPTQDEGADVAVDVQRAGRSTRVRDAVIGPGNGFAVAVPAGSGPEAVLSRWFDAPSVIGRVWERAGTGDVPGTVEAACRAAPSQQWIVPGMRTDGGASASLSIANPFGTDATVAVRLLTAIGPEDVLRLRNLVVPARGVLEVNLNEHAPQRRDLGAVVDVRAGRVVVEGLQQMNAAIGGIEGLSLIQAAPRPASAWTLPWFRDDDDSDSWLWVANPHDEDAEVSVTLHERTGARLPLGLDLVQIPALSTRRISLRGLLADESAGVPADGAPTSPDEQAVDAAPVDTSLVGADAPHAGLTVVVDHGPDVVVSLGSTHGAAAADPAADHGVRTGVNIALGTELADDAWTLVGGNPADRNVVLDLVNPGGETAVLDVRLWTELGPTTPTELSGLTLEPGHSTSVVLDPWLVGPTSVIFVTAREGTVVAGRRAHDVSGRLDLTATIGVPAIRADTDVDVTVREDLGLLGRLESSRRDG